MSNHGAIGQHPQRERELAVKEARDQKKILDEPDEPEFYSPFGQKSYFETADILQQNSQQNVPLEYIIHGAIGQHPQRERELAVKEARDQKKILDEPDEPEFYSPFGQKSYFETADQILQQNSQQNVPLEYIDMPDSFSYYSRWPPGQNNNPTTGPAPLPSTDDKRDLLEVDNRPEGKEEEVDINESSEARNLYCRARTTRRMTRVKLNKHCRRKALQEAETKEKAKQKISDDIDRLEDILEEIEKEAEVKKNKNFRKVKETKLLTTKESTQKDISAEVVPDMQKVHNTELGSYNPSTSESHQDILLAEAMQNFYKTLVGVEHEIRWNIRREEQKSLSRERRKAKKEKQNEKRKRNQKKK